MKRGPATVIFLSYARDDRHWAEHVERYLSSLGFALWRDLRDLRASEDFTGEIEVAIRRSSHFVVCLTADVRDRPDSFVRREIAYAESQRARHRPTTAGQRRPAIVPVVFPGGELPVSLATLTAVFVAHRHEFDSAMHRLVDQIRTDRPSPPPPPETPLQRYLRDLHEETSGLLEDSVACMLPLTARDTAGAALLAPRTRRLAVSTLLHSGDPAVADIAMPGGPARSSRVGVASAFERSGGRLLLLGEPGAGKTSSLLAFTRDAAVRAQQDETAPVPLMVSLRYWQGDGSLRDWALADARLGTMQGRRLLFVLDGLDELVDTGDRSGGSAALRLRVLDALERELARDDVLLSSRIAEFRQLGRTANLARAVSLLPLLPSQVQQYLRARGLAALAAIVDADPTWFAVARTPMVLVLLGLTYAGSVLPADAPAPKEAEVFDRYVSSRFQHEAERGEKLPYDEATTRKLLADHATRIVSRHDGRSAEPAFQRFAERMHLLRPVPGHASEFIHLKLRDHFALPQLQQWLADDAPEVTSMGFPVLAQMIGAPAWPILEALTLHASEATARSAISALCDIGGREQLRPLLAAWYCGDKNRWYQVERVLPRLAERYPETLVQALDDDVQRTRRNAVRLLTTLGPGVMPLALPYLRSPCSSTQCAALALLSALAPQLRAAEARRWIKPFLSHAGDEQRALATRALGRVAGRFPLVWLIECLDDANDNVAVEAALALAQRIAKRAVTPLLARLADARLSAFRRMHVAYALACLPGARALRAAMQHVVDDYEGNLRPSIVRTIGERIDAASARNFFIDRLANDPSSVVREFSVSALRALRDPRTATMLSRAAQVDAGPYVRDAAFLALAATVPDEAAVLASDILLRGPPFDAPAAVAIRHLVIHRGAAAETVIRTMVRHGGAFIEEDGEASPTEVGLALSSALSERQEQWARTLRAELPW